MKKIALVIAVAVLLSLFHFPLWAEETNYSRIVVCSKAFEALGRIADPRAKEVLSHGLKSPDFLLRASAVQALGRLNSKDVIPWLKTASRERNYLVSIFATKALVELGEFSYEKKLLNFLNDARPEVRANTVEQLGDFGNKYLFWLVRMLLNDKDALVRVKAIEQLGRNRFNPALSHIKTASKDNNPLIRQAACVALGRIGSEEEIVLLNLRLYDPDIYVRAAAKAALSSLIKPSKKKKPGVTKKDKFLELLWQDIKSPNPYTRASSYIALANLEETKIVPLVLKELVSADSPALIKREGARALMILKPYLSKLVGKSLGGLKVKDSSILNSSLQIYYSIDGKNLLTIFIDALRNAEDPLHKDAPLVLKELKESISYPFLRQALFNQDPGYQANVVYALGDLRDKDAVADIIKLCRQYGF